MYMYEYSIMKPNKYCLERRGEGRSKGIWWNGWNHSKNTIYTSMKFSQCNSLCSSNNS
jgi:hypothetical protein